MRLRTWFVPGGFRVIRIGWESHCKINHTRQQVRLLHSSLSKAQHKHFCCWCYFQNNSNVVGYHNTWTGSDYFITKLRMDWFWHSAQLLKHVVVWFLCTKLRKPTLGMHWSHLKQWLETRRAAAVARWHRCTSLSFGVLSRPETLFSLEPSAHQKV